MSNYGVLYDNLSSLLVIDRQVVGVKLVYTEEEFNEYSGIEPVKPMFYCVAVKSATQGHSIKLRQETSKCSGSNRAFGMPSDLDAFYRGESGYNLGLFKDKEVAASVARKQPIFKEEVFGIIVKPLNLFEKDPDIVLVFANTREAMRVMQGYTYVKGLAKNLNVSGNQAVCVESTVTPLMNKDINISLMCSGTRHEAKWKENEVLVSFPFFMAQDIIDGLKGTVNAVEEDKRKQEIEAGLSKTGSLDFEIEYGKTYYKI